ncbi:hypothetical protein AAVH_20399 [Aphelenchoides avenae]|nr:hypothetical protein AAVH_32758 [Aphelenchus avenae]KAH7712270.1 hypothetical protein AAVH_20399 [Aphelenchus avenae]
MAVDVLVGTADPDPRPGQTDHVGRRHLADRTHHRLQAAHAEDHRNQASVGQVRVDHPALVPVDQDHVDHRTLASVDLAHVDHHRHPTLPGVASDDSGLDGPSGGPGDVPSPPAPKTSGGNNGRGNGRGRAGPKPKPGVGANGKGRGSANGKACGKQRKLGKNLDVDIGAVDKSKCS